MLQSTEVRKKIKRNKFWIIIIEIKRWEKYVPVKLEFLNFYCHQ